jgi:alkylation response protein AidB-like acyl-CoA dehydrogenase
MKMSIINMNSEQKLIRSEVRKFSVAELDPISSDIEKEGNVPSEIVQKIAQMGLFGLTVPEKYGGSGLDMTSLCVTLEELGKSCASLALMVATNNCLVAQPILKFGSSQMQEDYLRKISSGAIGGCAPYSEIETSGQGFMLEQNGESLYVSGKCDVVLSGQLADFVAVPVKSGSGVSLYIVDRDQPGMNIYPVGVMGMRAAGVRGLEFNRAKVLKENRLGNESVGRKTVEYSLEIARIGYSAIALGLTQASLDGSVKYAKERKQFGRAISEFPMIRDMLAEVKVHVEKNRLLVYDAASKVDGNEDYRMAARVACLTSCEGAVFSALKAIQIHGGYGYTRDYPVERYFRDAKSLQLLGEVPVDIKSRIAGEILL